jgi:hypothetical protein
MRYEPRQHDYVNEQDLAPGLEKHGISVDLVAQQLDGGGAGAVRPERPWVE